MIISCSGFQQYYVSLRPLLLLILIVATKATQVSFLWTLDTVLDDMVERQKMGKACPNNFGNCLLNCYHHYYSLFEWCIPRTHADISSGSSSCFVIYITAINWLWRTGYPKVTMQLVVIDIDIRHIVWQPFPLRDVWGPHQSLYNQSSTVTTKNKLID